MLYCCMQVFLEFWERSMRRKLRRHVWNMCVCIFAKAIFHMFVPESLFLQVRSYNHHRSSPGSEHGSFLCFQVFLNGSYSNLLCCRLAVLHIHFGDGRCHVRQNTARMFTLLQSYWVRYVAKHNWHQSGFSTSELALQASSHGSCMMNQDWKVMPAWCFCHLRPSIMDSVQSDFANFWFEERRRNHGFDVCSNAAAMLCHQRTTWQTRVANGFGSAMGSGLRSTSKGGGISITTMDGWARRNWRSCERRTTMVRRSGTEMRSGLRLWRRR